MGLSEEATQMVRGGFEPETFRSQARHLAIVATPRRQNTIITNECNTGFVVINQFDPALDPIIMFVMIVLSALIGEVS